ERAGGDGITVLAHAARLAVFAQLEAVECPGENPRRRRLPGAARAGEEVGMADAVFAHGVLQRGRDVFLPDELRKKLRPVLAVQAVRRHALTLPARHRRTCPASGRRSGAVA